MGNKQSVRKIGFEDIKYLQSRGNKFIIINTLHETDQSCLIKGTITPKDEVTIINRSISKPTLLIIIYFAAAKKARKKCRRKLIKKRDEIDEQISTSEEVPKVIIEKKKWVAGKYGRFFYEEDGVDANRIKDKIYFETKQKARKEGYTEFKK